MKESKTTIHRNEPVAIILAAGRGTRLRPLTRNTPKCLLPVGGLPILHHQLGALRDHGITRVAIVIGFKGRLVRDYAETWFPDIPFTFVSNQRFGSTNTLYSLALAAKHLVLPIDVFLLNGDVMFDSAILARLEGLGHHRSYAAAKVGPCGKEEVKIKLSSEGAVAGLSKAIAPSGAVGEAVGIYKFSPAFWQALASNLMRLKEDYPHEYFEYAIEQTIRQGERIFLLDVGRLAAVEIDYPKDLEHARNLFVATGQRHND